MKVVTVTKHSVDCRPWPQPFASRDLAATTAYSKCKEMKVHPDDERDHHKQHHRHHRHHHYHHGKTEKDPHDHVEHGSDHHRKINRRKKGYRYLQLPIRLAMILFPGVLIMFFGSIYLLSSVATKLQNDNESNINPAIPWKPTPLQEQQQRQKQQQRLLPLTAHLGQKTNSQQKLRSVVYGNVRSCQDLPDKWPVHHPTSMDHEFGPNVGRLFNMFPIREKYAYQCPVDTDPFLPWIHDVFVSHDVHFVEFVAANKRRCRTAYSFLDDLQNLEPQVALFQSVPIKRLSEQEVKSWIPNDGRSQHDDPNIPRYRLSSLEEADEDGRESRFICRFHSTSETGKSRFVAETLSVYPYNYEYAHLRKGAKKPMLTTPKDKNDRRGAHNEAVWNAINHFRCPIPERVREIILSSAQTDDVHLRLDLVPIRTPPRTNETYFPQAKSGFAPNLEWGDKHILPRVEDSGRWANIPLCRVSKSTSETSTKENPFDFTEPKDNMRPYDLIGCLWTSAAFSTRGADSLKDTSVSQRLLEWLTYHLYIAGFDHVYVYDNSDPSSGRTLQPVLDLFPTNRVTRIVWPHRVCNNNKPMHINAGERSSQYAAETSCRLRYGPLSRWISHLDVDEYLIPQQKWTSVRDWLLEREKAHTDTHIYSFFQTRAVPNVALMDPYRDNGKECRNNNCVVKRENVTFLQTYDCERTPLPKPDYGWRAKKQIYDPTKVLNHFVHYSLVTTRILSLKEPSNPFFAGQPYEIRVNEVDDVWMLHTKSTYPEATKRWEEECKVGVKESKNCPVGIPHRLYGYDHYSNGTSLKGRFINNCYPHSRIQEDLVPRLQQLLRPLKERFGREAVQR
jgi:Glycosyltransferase family 92